jgi:RNA polymerase sigma-70 factor (ECF subfamily)
MESKGREDGPCDGDTSLAAAGDETAFSRLMEKNAGMLYRVCRTILRSEADCTDAVQETVIAAWRNIARLKNGSSFSAWVARICINRCYSIARKRRPTEPLGDHAAPAQRSDERLDVMKAVAGLPENMRLAVVFHYFEDWSVEEAARALGTHPGTVKSRLHRARRLLAERLYDYEEEYRNGSQR